jgi:hypothetical protein
MASPIVFALPGKTEVYKTRLQYGYLAAFLPLLIVKLSRRLFWRLHSVSSVASKSYKQYVLISFISEAKTETVIKNKEYKNGSHNYKYNLNVLS